MPENTRGLNLASVMAGGSDRAGTERLMPGGASRVNGRARGNRRRGRRLYLRREDRSGGVPRRAPKGEP
jgi:hypothetical protein